MKGNGTMAIIIFVAMIAALGLLTVFGDMLDPPWWLYVLIGAACFGLAGVLEVAL
ncbi:MAG: hypothetical protein ACRDQA_02425 [Nocardioidaceae bacterium]